ncbi:MAG TPA: sodium/solute symporter [Opitutaceae bacterium]|nr:sodium/solute symporter [Opitutaceae bacterium]
MTLSLIDLSIIAVYFAAIGAVGLYVSRGQKTAESYFVARRSIPMWAVAFTLMATIISTGTIVGHPGTAYQKGLILLIPHLTVPLVLLVVARVVVPFYRRVIRMSAYEYIGERFGLGGRFYTSFGFLADRIFDLGVTLLTTALAVNVLTGWDLVPVILGVGLFTILYTMIGGVTAVVWTDVVQGVVLMAGGLFILARLMFAPEAGPAFAVVGETYRQGKLTLGTGGLSWDLLFAKENHTMWLFILAYAVQWTRRYSTDQHMVQRYLVAKDDKSASRAAFLSAVVCVPIFALFMFCGACLNGFFTLSQLPPPPMPDSVMPYFLAHYMPVGLLGIVVAAILAAAMSTVSADLSSVATVLTTDYFRHFVPRASDRAMVACGRTMVVVGGAATIVVAWLLLPKDGSAPLMERVVIIASILAGGTLGLFCLGFFSRIATRRGCYVGIAVCLIYTAWAILTQPGGRMLDLGRFNFPLNPLLIGVVGHLVLFSSGWIASRLLGGYRPADVERLTYWHRAAASTPAP